MFVVAVDWSVAPEDAEGFADLLRRQARNSLHKEPACRQFDVAQDPDRPERFFLYEVYDDAAAFDTHRGMPYFGPFSEAAEAMTVSKEVRLMTRIADGG